MISQKKISQVISILLLILLWLSGITTLGIAQDEAVLAVDPDSVTVPLGNQVQLNLEVSDGADVNGFDLLVNYDFDRLSLIAWEHGGYLSNLNCTRLINQPGYFELTCAQQGQSEVDGDGILLELTFDTLAVGLPDVTITEATFSDSKGGITYPQLQNGEVEVTNDPTYTPTPTKTATPSRTSTSKPSPTFSITPAITRTDTPVPGQTQPSATETISTVATSTQAGTDYPLATTEASLSTPVLTPTPLIEGRLTPMGTVPGYPIPGATGEIPGEEGAVEPTSPESGSETPSQSKHLLKSLWRDVLWGVLILCGVWVLGMLIVFIHRRGNNNQEEDLLL